MASDINTRHFLYRWVPHKYHPYISLARLDRPIGYMLLYYPCIWGLMLSWNVRARYDVQPVMIWDTVVIYSVLFLLGAVVMRGAGCAWNDIQDRHFDARVSRTKNRPLAAGHITVSQAYMFVIILLIIGAVVLVLLPPLAIISALMACIPAIMYPFFKRLTYFPQLWLGVTFNWGIWVGWFSVLPADVALQLNTLWIPFVVHVLGLLWTLAYDTVYAHQDRKDDIRAGVKSSAIAFDDRTYMVLWVCYGGIVAILTAVVWVFRGGIYPYVGIVGMGITIAIWIRTLRIECAESCKTFFRLNRFVGIFISAILFTCLLP